MRRLIELISFLITFSIFSFSFFYLSSTCYAEEPPPAFTLNTNAFLSEGILPVLYTCDGKDVSPQFDWTNAPAKTETFALIFSDISMPEKSFYHWILFNIPKTVTNLDEGIKPTGMNVGKNDWNKQQYNGPCPPKGAMHTYVFTLYALDTKLSLSDGADGKAVLAALKDHIVSKTELSLVYNRWIV